MKTLANVARVKCSSVTETKPWSCARRLHRRLRSTKTRKQAAGGTPWPGSASEERACACARASVCAPAAALTLVSCGAVNYSGVDCELTPSEPAALLKGSAQKQTLGSWPFLEPQTTSNLKGFKKSNRSHVPFKTGVSHHVPLVNACVSSAPHSCRHRGIKMFNQQFVKKWWYFRFSWNNNSSTTIQVLDNSQVREK